MGKYQFTDSWLLEADISDVWHLISHFEQINCWQGVSFDKLNDQDHPAGIGDKYLMNMKTKLWYSLSFHFHVIEKQAPCLIRLQASGDLKGYGVFRLEQVGNCTRLHYYWEAQTRKFWMNLCEPWMRPFFIWNHNRVVGEGIRGLSDYLRSPLL